MELLFWCSVLLIVYIYIGYPVLVGVLSRRKAVVEHKNNSFPKVSILIAAYNEEECIVNTLNNKLSLDYPRDKYEIIVVSDECTDSTDALVQQVSESADVSIRLIRQVPRRGKTSGLNLIVPEATGEIIVFSDANSIWETDVLEKLTSNFQDANVGYVTGKMVYVNQDGTLIGDGCSSYMKYENWLRRGESALGSIVGVDGGIDAMRKALYESLRADQLPDFVQPLKVVEKGYRVVYDDRAILKEDSLDSMDDEYRMRVRVSLRAMWALLDMRQLLNPLKFSFFSWQLFSHKVLRYFAFMPICLAFVANALLIGESFYTAVFIGQVLFYMLALQGHSSSGKNLPNFVALPYYFVILNVACAHAFVRFIKGEKQVIWTPRVG